MTIDANLIQGVKIGFSAGMIFGVIIAAVGAWWLLRETQ